MAEDEEIGAAGRARGAAEEEGEEEEQQQQQGGIGRQSGISSSPPSAPSFGDWTAQSGDGGGDGDDGSLRTDYEVLRRVWTNEKAAPEILPYEQELVDRIQEQISLMEDNIAALSTEISDELMLSLYRMDVNRTLFLLRSYLRTRLCKIERYPVYITNSADVKKRLSGNEVDYAFSYAGTLAKHLEQTVLNRLPAHYQSMEKQTTMSPEDDMTPKPQLDTFVFCKSNGAIGSFQIDDKGDETVDLMKDDLHILRYKPVRRLLETNMIYLI